MSVFDVARYILAKAGPMTAMKLQKLVYYSQAWSLVWDETPLFEEEIQAWANGPVVPALYDCHRGQYAVSDIAKGNPDNVEVNAKDTIDRVICFYGQFNPQQLSDLTHMESPWKVARQGLPDGDRSDRVISLESMAEYYSSI